MRMESLSKRWNERKHSRVKKPGFEPPAHPTPTPATGNGQPADVSASLPRAVENAIFSGANVSARTSVAGTEIGVPPAPLLSVCGIDQALAATLVFSRVPTCATSRQTSYRRRERFLPKHHRRTTSLIFLKWTTPTRCPGYFWFFRF